MLVIFNERAAPPDIPIYPEPLALNGFGRLGITDNDTPTGEEQRTAFRGLISAMVRMRQHAIAQAILDSTVSRRVGFKEYEPVEESHPWNRLIYNPSPNYSPFKFWADVSGMRDMGKGAHLAIGRGARNVPESLYAIYPDFGEVRCVPEIDGGIMGYVYTGPELNQEIPAENLIWIRHDHPVTPYEGASLLEQAAYQSDISLYQQIYARDLTFEGNIPNVYAKASQPITTNQAQEYGRTLTKEYRTPGRRNGKTLVLGHDMELKTISMSPDDMQYIESASLNDRQLMRIFGFPPAMFEQSGVVANSAEVRKQWLQNSIQPEVRSIVSSLEHQLKRAFGAMDSNLCIIPPDVVPVDRLEQARIDEIEIRTMITKPNEVRLRKGADEDPDLDQFFTGASIRPLKDILAVEDQQPDPQMEPALDQDE